MLSFECYTLLGGARIFQSHSSLMNVLIYIYNCLDLQASDLFTHRQLLALKLFRVLLLADG